jgi:hypothetical protein
VQILPFRHQCCNLTFEKFSHIIPALRMEVLQMYNDVPAIELGADDYSIENFPPYASPAALSQYWGSIDPSFSSRRSSDTYQIDTSAHLVNMEKHILNLANSAYGHGHSPAFDVHEKESHRFGLNATWGSGGEALRSMRYMSPNGPWGGTLSSTNSTPSDYAISPNVSRHHASLFRDDSDSQMSFGSPYPVPLSHNQYNYTCQGSYPGRFVASPTSRDQAVTYSMKELQYTPDPQNDDSLEEDSDCIKVGPARPETTATTPGSCCFAIDTSQSSEYDNSIMDEDDEKCADNGDDPAYSPRRSAATRRRSSSNKQQQRSPTNSRHSFMKPAVEGNKVLKSSQRQIMATKNKTKNITKRRTTDKNGEPRPFVCSFSHYGCESRFSSKNEWKRHVLFQHLKLGFYRCDTGPCNPDDPSRVNGNRTYNDFNRKDLFTQHHRRMHTPWPQSHKPPSKEANEGFEQGLEAVRQRCWRQERQPPKKSDCIFCHVRFEGDSAWEERMEHIGKHFEKSDRDKKAMGEAKEDVELRIWALEQGIIVDCGKRGYWLTGLQDIRGSGKAVSAAMSKQARAMESDAIDEDAVGDDE